MTRKTFEKENIWKNDNPMFPPTYTREYVRKVVGPSAQSNIVFPDIDLVQRQYSQEDPKGRFRFIEFKYGQSRRFLPHSQEMSFSRINEACADKDFYYGFYLIWSDIPDLEKACEITINNVRVTQDELYDFLNWKGPEIKSLWGCFWDPDRKHFQDLQSWARVNQRTFEALLRQQEQGQKDQKQKPGQQLTMLSFITSIGRI